jgi:two-component system sensor histidine kinase KdpD
VVCHADGRAGSQGGRRVTGAGRGVSAARRAWGLALTATVLPLGTAGLVAARGELATSSVLLLYLLAVVVISAVGGAVPGCLAAAVSFGLVLWFFTPPFHTLAVHGRDAVVDVVVFGVVACVVSALVELAARARGAHQRQLAEQTARTRELAAEDRARSALLAAVGHDLRTPLASIKVAVGTLRHPGVAWSPAQVDELLATIEDSSDRLTSLITNLLDMTRLRADAVTARPEPVALDEVVARSLLREHSGAVDVRVGDHLPLVRADPGLLERVVANLVENAVRYSPPGATVEVSADQDEDPSGGGAPSRAGTVRLHVVDHGPGIPAAERERVFAPFGRLDDRGPGPHVGLGLAIAAGFTEAMGGRLTPSTTPGGGLTMTVELPVARS